MKNLARSLLALVATVVLAACGSSRTAVGRHADAGATRTAGTGETTAGATGTTGATGITAGTTGTPGGGTSGGSGTSGTSGSGCGLRTCASAHAECGPIGDGCGGIVQCGDCPVHQFCGGGGPSKCGVTPCTPTPCAALGASCGVVSDGCGGTLSCGTCSGSQICGGGGPNKCGGVATDGGPTSCVPRTCAQAGANCGPVADGCGGIIQCGTCPTGQTCGAGGPSRCGAPPCTPTSCTAHGANCGVIADGCGGTLSCGTCISSQICGGGGPNKCGAPASSCAPRTCAQAGANCGPVADGCGGLIQCGTCTPPQICGGGGVPSVCGDSNRPDGGTACTNLCLQQQACSGGGTTRVSGKVYAPNGVDPLYDALVYVPNGAVQPFSPGVTCLTCDAQVTGQPLVSTTTGPDGSFTLSNMPAGSNIPLVIQLGRWRRQVTIPSVAGCASTALPAALTRLPKNHTEGDIPLTAMVTGSVDALECVLRKIGIDDAEFTNPSGAGRIRLYWAAGSGGGAAIDSNTRDSTALIDSPSELAKYDMVLFACEGYRNDKSGSELSNVQSYANVGGRVFATHFSYTWLYTNTPWGCGNGCSTAGQTAAAWNVDQWFGSSITGILDTSFPKGQAFSQWLDAVGASTAPGSGQISIANPRWDADAVVSPAQRWIYTTGSRNTVQHLTFNTPLGAPAAQQCGRVLFSDFHVADAATDPTVFYPSECGTGPMTAQEHVLEFMLFDLASCVTPDQPPPPTCTPRTCQQAGANCGPVGDGCGGTLGCGSCPAGQTCGGGGTPSVCGAASCAPLTCAQQGIGCGPAGDGCGGTLSCGSCPAGQTCGGGGVASQCGAPACTPTTCAAQGANCGPIADGCGGTLQCGTCPAGLTCGGGGPSVCGTSICTPLTCAQQGILCGPAGDGCGGTLSCGTCKGGELCGGAGTPNQCGTPPCTPTSCQAQGARCGPIANGCGGTIDCGSCPAGQTCGLGGANICGGFR